MLLVLRGEPSSCLARYPSRGRIRITTNQEYEMRLLRTMVHCIGVELISKSRTLNGYEMVLFLIIKMQMHQFRLDVFQFFTWNEVETF